MSDIPIFRRDFLETLGIGSLGAVMVAGPAAPTLAAEQPQPKKKWEPVSDRKLRFGIVGYGVCSFGAAFGFQDHPNVEIVAVSDLIPERRLGLMKACRCEKSHDSLEYPFTDEIALFQTSEGGASRMCMCKAVNGKDAEAGRVFGERGWMEGTTYRGVAKELPDIERPPLPPGVAAGGHGGSHGQLSHEFVTAILENREPLVNVYEALAMTVPGIIAHQSALKDGESLKIPQYDRTGN